MLFSAFEPTGHLQSSFCIRTCLWMVLENGLLEMDGATAEGYTGPELMHSK